MQLYYSFTFEIMHKVIAIWGLVLIAITANAQSKSFCIQSEIDTLHLTATDSFDAASKIQKQILAKRETGYLAASLDSLVLKNDTFFATVYWGKPFNYIKLTSHNLGKGYVLEAENAVLSRVNFLKIQAQLLSDYENMGYPFASISLDSTQIENDTLSASALFFSYNQILYDSIQINGKSNTTRHTVSRTSSQKY